MEGVPELIVIDRVPALGAGLAAMLREDGFTVRQAARSRPGVRGVLVTVDADDDLPTQSALLSGHGSAVVIAVLVADGRPDPLPALRAGAHAVVAWDTDAAELATVVRAALSGLTALPSALVRTLVRQSPAGAPGSALSPDDVRWLRALAAGRSVVALAESEGYSQREVFRRLAGLYRRMGAGNRQEAISLAATWGALDEARLHVA